MQSKNSELIRQIFDSALKRSPAEREKFLAEICAGDRELYDAVQNQLVSVENDFFEQTVDKQLANTIIVEQEKFQLGQKYGQYKIVKLLGVGGMGEVFLAEDTKLERLVALKILAADFARNDDYVRRFVQEAKAASALNHPNIVTIYEAGKFGEIRFIATEYIKGETLRRSVKREEPFSSHEKIVEIAVQIAAALEAAHEAGIVHRDIKPENIIVRDDNLVKVLDFGLAKLVEKKLQTFDAEAETYAPVQTIAGMLLGTISYMSPEQTRGLETDARSDLWSLGVVLYEVITGRLPFESTLR